MQAIKLDLKDRKILSILDWDARATNSEIAKKVRLSKKGVEYRIKKLEEKGVIQGYYPVIDFMRSGYRVLRICINLKFMTDDLKNNLEGQIKKNKFMS